jgi:hypothetical protein
VGLSCRTLLAGSAAVVAGAGLAAGGTTLRRAAGLLVAARLGQRAPIKMMSRIDSPGAFGRVSPDSPITGIAWAQTKGIEKVEVRIDHGQWRSAELSTEVNVDTWRMFRLRGRWDPGNHVAEVRATDKTDYAQAAERAAPIPDGASGWHSVQFTVR